MPPPDVAPDAAAMLSSIDGSVEPRLLQALIDNLPSAVSFFGPDLEMVTCNARFRTLLDFPDALFAQGLPSLPTLVRFNAERGEYGPGDPEALTEREIAWVRDARPTVHERLRPDGTLLEVRATPLAGGGIVITHTDVTERRRADEEVRRARDLMSAAITASAAFVWELDAEGRYTTVHGAENILGWRDSDLLGQPFASFHTAAAEAEADAATREAIAAGRPFRSVHIRLRHKAGHTVHIASSGHPVRSADGTLIGYRGVDVDVTELTEARLALERMALHDPLTGLANRHKLLERFALERDRKRRTGAPLSLLVIDVDRFKGVNDRHGHLAGDSVLRHVAEVLRGAVRTTDLVARFGGEEFVVLLPDTDAEGARTLADTLRRRVADRPAVIMTGSRRKRIRVTISVGAATAATSGPADFDALMETADAAVFRAKTDGRDRVVHAADDLAL